MKREKLSAQAEVIVHKDGTATYWSVYQQRWMMRRPFAAISSEDYASMHPQERERVLRRVCGD